jgi:hypothetical protein
LTVARLIPIIATTLAAISVPAASGAPVRDTGCSIPAGSVDTFVQIATAGCPLSFSGPIYRGEGVKTSGPGLIMFHTTYLAQCREFSGSADIVSPTLKVALRHLYGTTWCKDSANGRGEFLTTPGVKIALKGTVIGLTAGRHNIAIKVAEGLAAVTVTGHKQPVQVKQGQQLNLTTTPGRQLKLKPTPLVLSPADRLAVAELQYHVVEIDPQESDPFVTGQGQNTAVVVGSNDTSSKLVSSQLKKTQSSTLSAFQVISQPATLRTALERTGAKIVLTAGDPNALEKVWALARTTITPDLELVFVGQ